MVIILQEKKKTVKGRKEKKAMMRGCIKVTNGYGTVREWLVFLVYFFLYQWLYFTKSQDAINKSLRVKIPWLKFCESEEESKHLVKVEIYCSVNLLWVTPTISVNHRGTLLSLSCYCRKPNVITNFKKSRFHTNVCEWRKIFAYCDLIWMIVSPQNSYAAILTPKSDGVSSRGSSKGDYGMRVEPSWMGLVPL